MLIQVTATPAGRYVVQDLVKEVALQYWDNKEALELLGAIVKQQVPEKFNLELLSGLIERGFAEFSTTTNLASDHGSDELFEAFANPNF